MSDIKLISIPMDRFKQLESVYDAAMELSRCVRVVDGRNVECDGWDKAYADLVRACRRAKEWR